jgi:hypothetical protein
MMMFVFAMERVRLTPVGPLPAGLRVPQAIVGGTL